MKRNKFQTLRLNIDHHIHLHKILQRQDEINSQLKQALAEREREFEQLRKDIPFIVDYQHAVRTGETPIFQDIDGNQYTCDTMEAFVKFSHLEYAMGDPGIIRILPKILRENVVIFDVGAHIGGFCIPCARLVQNSGKVIAFEPEKRNYEILVENISLNNLENRVEANKFAIFNQNQLVELQVFPRLASSWTSLAYYAYKNHTPEKIEVVEAITLDSFTIENGYDYIDILKIDVEGFESEVLEGAERLLSENKIENIIFEISTIPLQKSSHKIEDTLGPMLKHGFDFYTIHADGSSSLTEVDVIMKTPFGNYLACKKSV